MEASKVIIKTNFGPGSIAESPISFYMGAQMLKIADSHCKDIVVALIEPFKLSNVYLRMQHSFLELPSA